MLETVHTRLRVSIEGSLYRQKSSVTALSKISQEPPSPASGGSALHSPISSLNRKALSSRNTLTQASVMARAVENSPRNIRGDLTAVLSTLDPEAQTEFLLNNMDVLRMYDRTRGVLTPQIAEVIHARTNTEDAVCVKYHCARCLSSDNIHIFDRRRFASCNSCGHLWERTSSGEGQSCYDAARLSQLQRSGVSTGELKAKSGSVYSSMVHYRNFLLRLCGLSIPQLSDAVWAELDRRLEVHGLLEPDHADSDTTLRLSSYTFWFEMLKTPLHTDERPTNLSPYYHYIYYLIRLYTPAGTSHKPLLSGQERSRLIAAFRCIRDYYIAHGKEIFAEYATPGDNRPRKNLWSYGNITAILLRIMGRHDALITHSEILHEHYLVGGIESGAGRILHLITHTLAPQLYRILKWPYIGHGARLE